MDSKKIILKLYILLVENTNGPMKACRGQREQTDNLEEVFAQQWLSASQLDFGNALLHEESWQRQDLRGGEQVLLGAEVNPLLWHAVLAWQQPPPP